MTEGTAEGEGKSALLIAAVVRGMVLARKQMTAVQRRVGESLLGLLREVCEVVIFEVVYQGYWLTLWDEVWY